MSESPGIRVKQAGLYNNETGIPNPEEDSNQSLPVFLRTVRKRNKMGYYYNSSDDHGEDIQFDLAAHTRRVEVSSLHIAHESSTSSIFTSHTFYIRY